MNKLQVIKRSRKCRKLGDPAYPIESLKITPVESNPP